MQNGASGITIFDRIMKATLHVQILKNAAPFLAWLTYFLGACMVIAKAFMQDNDPEHTSRIAKAFIRVSNINCMVGSHQSLLIATLWRTYGMHELK